MLGVIIGAVSTISILVFLQYDPKAVKQRQQEQKKVKEEQQAQMKKAQEEREKVISDPAAVEKRESAKKAMKEKMLKGLSEEERKLIGDYFSEKKHEGKSQQQIMKDASIKAFAFICILAFITLLACVLIFIIYTGKEEEVVDAVGQLLEAGKKFIEWNFPRVGNMTVGAPQGQL